MKQRKLRIQRSDAWPLPPATRVSKYPFSKLEVGDSFFVPDDFGLTRNAVRCAVLHFNKVYRGERLFITRSAEVNGRRGQRVYRVPLDFKPQALRRVPLPGEEAAQ